MSRKRCVEGAHACAPLNLSGGVRPTAVALVGTAPIGNEFYDKYIRKTDTYKREKLPPSDHKGLLVTVGPPKSAAPPPSTAAVVID